MKVKLVHASYGLGEFEGKSAEELLVYMARVSSDRENKFETPEKLLTWMIKNNHWSPFEMTSLCFEIKTSRFVGRQILRHKSMSFQEFSQRYMTVSDFEEVVLRKQAETNRQSSTEVINETVEYYTEDGSTKASLKMDDLVSYYLKEIKNVYTLLINNGVSKESARLILPEVAETTMYVHGNVRSWFHYFGERLKEETQAEHREVATALFNIFKEHYPIISKLIKDDSK